MARTKFTAMFERVSGKGFIVGLCAGAICVGALGAGAQSEEGEEGPPVDVGPFKKAESRAPIGIGPVAWVIRDNIAYRDEDGNWVQEGSGSVAVDSADGHVIRQREANKIAASNGVAEEELPYDEPWYLEAVPSVAYDNGDVVTVDRAKITSSVSESNAAAVADMMDTSLTKLRDQLLP